MYRGKNGVLWLTMLIAVAMAFSAGAAFADLRVNVMPSGASSQANIWDSKGPYTWPGNNLELWGNVAYNGAGALTYTWNFGAGEGTASGTVTNRNNIAVYHTYAATGSYVATLTVTDGTETDTDTVFIDVVPQSLGVRKNLAIQKGLKWQYLNKLSTTVNNCPAYYWASYTTAGAALAILAFENHGHLEINDPDADIYAETVQGSLNFLFYYMYGSAATMDNTTYLDSDINGNGRKIYGATNNLYYAGLTAMAIAGTATPDAIVRDCGSAEVSGKPYREVLEDLVDFIAFAQNDNHYNYGGTDVFGGWRYSANYGTSDNSVTQWPVLALGESAKSPWNISAPVWVPARLQSWLASSQYSNGGYGYTYASYWYNVAKTGAGIAGITYAGGGGNLANALNFIASQWGSTAYDSGNIGDHYAMYAVKKGMEYADLSLVGGHDWQAEYDQWLVDHQQASGSWPASVRIDAANLRTAFGLLVLAPLEVCKPLANAGGDQEVAVGDPVNLDGSASTHSCPDDHNIIAYEWDFDYDGVNFDVDGSGETATNSAGYAITNGGDTQDYTVALRVTDDQGRVSLDTLIVTVTNGNVAPVADAGGPYLGGVGEDITLNGLGSYDENSAGGANPIANPATPSGFDEIVSYQWDIDGDGLYGTDDTPADPEGPQPVVNFGSFIGTKTIGLKATDSFGRSSAQSTQLTTVAVSDLYPLSYELVSNVYNRYTRMFTVTWRVNIRNDGNGAAYDALATLTPDSIPAGVTINDDSVAWTVPDATIDPGETQLSDDSFSYTYPRGGAGLDLTVITWDIEFTDALGVRHVVRNIPQE